MPPLAAPPSEVIDWFERFRAFRAERSQGRLVEFKNAFQRLGANLKPLQERAAQRAREEAPDFNVFRILRLTRREVATHTPFLANLLDPAGSHAQGDLFLRCFWDRLSAKRLKDGGHPPLPPLPALDGGARWAVLTEQVTDRGNFDIHLRCRAIGCLMVIENKIGAGDQEDQLARYWAQMETERTLFLHRELVYLTPLPRDPVPTNEDLPPFTNLTYRSDITVMIGTALQSITAPRLRHSLEQYLEIIHAL